MTVTTQILPSLLAADFTQLGAQIQAVEQGGATMLHYDVMDGRFVPNISMGIPVLESIRKVTKAWLDVHLMIVEPERYVEAFRAAGADSISVHQEASPHLHRTLGLIQSTGAKAGIVLNPATPVHTLDDVLGLADFVLLMSVNPGFGGQKFIPAVLDKIRALDRKRQEHGFSFAIEIDGGVDSSNAAAIAAAGCDWLVAGSSVFRRESPATGVQELTTLARQARMRAS
jgi:ribulose-phosphate 3-epimerase